MPRSRQVAGIFALFHKRNKCAHNNYRGKQAGAQRYRLSVVVNFCLNAAQLNFFFLVVYAQAVLYVLSDLFIGQNVLRAVFQQLFYVFHCLPSPPRCCLSFLSASLFFHVTVPIGISSISATSRRL